MKKYTVELFVGVFVVIGIAAMGYLSIQLGDVKIFSNTGYPVYASFDSTSGLKTGAVVEIAGVEVGIVKDIQLNEDFLSRVKMEIMPGVAIPDDSIASIRTRGIIGEKFIKLSPGGSDNMVKAGGRIMDTESSVDIEELVSKYIFSQEKDKTK